MLVIFRILLLYVCVQSFSPAVSLYVFRASPPYHRILTAWGRFFFSSRQTLDGSCLKIGWYSPYLLNDVRGWDHTLTDTPLIGNNPRIGYLFFMQKMNLQQCEVNQLTLQLLFMHYLVQKKIYWELNLFPTCYGVPLISATSYVGCPLPVYVSLICEWLWLLRGGSFSMSSW